MMRAKIHCLNGVLGRKHLRKTDFAGTHWCIDIGDRQYYIGRSSWQERWVLGITPRDVFTKEQWEKVFTKITEHFANSDVNTVNNEFTISV